MRPPRPVSPIILGNVERAIVRLCADGWPCTIREIADAVGSPSTGHVHAAVRRLADAGKVEVRGKRGVRPAQAGISLVRDAAA